MLTLLLITFIFFQLIDTLTTLYAVSKGAQELNPFYSLFKPFKFSTTLIFVKVTGTVAFLVIALIVYPVISLYTLLCIAIIDIVYFFVIANNLYQIGMYNHS